MEWTHMRESFLCGAFAQPAIRSGEAAGIFSEWDLYYQCGPVTFLEGNTLMCGSVIPLGQIGSRKAWEPPCYARMYEG